jgi:DNA-binding protein H-NS
MPSVNLKSMGVDELIALRAQVDQRLAQKQRELRDALSTLESKLGSVPARMGRASRLRGGKVAPKYRSPTGETWAGRGARPRWLVELLKQGHKIERFLIDKSDQASAGNKSAAKRGRKRKAA